MRLCFRPPWAEAKKLPVGDTRDIVADKLGVSGKTVDNAIAAIDALDAAEKAGDAAGKWAGNAM